MDGNTKANGSMTKCTDSENSHGPMEKSMKVHTLMIKNKEKEGSTTEMVRFTKENGLKADSMEEENSKVEMDEFTKEDMSMENLRCELYIFGHILKQLLALKKTT